MSDAPSGLGDPGGQAVRGCPACRARLPATARFCPSCGRSVEPGPSDERRPVTILFLDIVGSTAIAERLDAEDWKAMVDPALATFTAIVERHGGRVAQLLGDGLLAFFGAPVAHEDDAARAVRAGLDLVGAARTLGRQAIGSQAVGSQAIHLEIRVGINTGDVVVGAVGGEGRSEYLAVGDAVNVAARLQSVAPPMGVLISAETHRLVATEVDGRPVGPLALKGKAEPVTGFEVVAIQAVGGHRRRVREAAALVGRERQLAGLTGCGERLRAGAGSVAWIVGEPGLGKTRLVLEWRRALLDPESTVPGVRWVEASCPTIGRELPYHLARECLRGFLGLAGNSDHARMRREVESAASGLADLEDAVPLLARLLDLPPTPEDEAALAGLDGRAVQRRLARAFRAVFEQATSNGPIVLVAEDIHWIDPSSAELMAELVHAVTAQPLLMCMTMRPDPTPGVERIDREIGALPDDARVELRLEPLDDAAQRRLAAELLEDDDLPLAVRSAILDRSDGNPLFVEELIATLLERGLLRREVGGWSIDARGPDTVPASLQGLLLASLDALPRPIHRLAMIGSVIGREAPLGLVRAVAGLMGEAAAERAADAAALAGVIDAAGLLQLGGRDGDILTFRHALVHDAAYGSLVRADRRALHEIVGRRLEHEAELAGRLDEAATTLAYHFGRAEDHEPTIRYGRIAAERAAASYANAEALALYDTTIEAGRAHLGAGPYDADDRDARLDLVRLLEARCTILELVGRVDETGGSYSEALGIVPADQVAWRARLEMLIGSAAGDRGHFAEAEARYIAAEATLGARPPDDDPDWWKAWIDIRGKRVDRAYWLADTNEMEQLIASLEEPVNLHGTPLQRAAYHDLMASYLQRRDRYVPSQEVLDHKLASAAATAELGNRRSMAWARFTLGFTCTWNLDFDAAERALAAALADAERIGDALLEARSITYLSVVLRRQGRVAETLLLAERTIAASRPLGAYQYVAIALANRAWAELRLGDVATARLDAETAERTWPAELSYPFRWLGLWPLVAVDVAEARTNDALPRCEALLDPSQQPPAAPVAEALSRVLAAADDPRELAAALQVALDRAREHAYL
jgi:class 3 adenylate cyclase/tetratricopeptide (TPR) repeat protein